MTQRQTMLAAFADVHHQFKQARAHYQTQEASITAALNALDAVAGKAAVPTQALNAQHPVMHYLHTWQQQSQQVRRAWQQRVAAYHDVNAFRDKVGDSFLLYVYGKVNAGKSSLGNFVATGEARPQTLPSGALRFGWQASSQGHVQEQSLTHGFGVDRSECTSAIQFFSLPGLTWVDSPGLHSTTTENGELARTYAEASDMVVYLMNARNPGRQSDNDELRYLMTLKKPLHIVLSRSDCTEEDENDDGDIVKTFCMKSPADRQQQEQYVRQQLDELAAELGMPEAASQCQVVSLSVGYAEKAQSEEAWEDSGMATFFAAMTRMAHGDSVRFKQHAPLERLRAFRDDLKTGAQQLAQSQRQLEVALQRLGQDVEQTAERLHGRLALRLAALASQQPDEAYRDTQALSAQFHAAIAPEMQQMLETALKEQLGTFEDSMARALDFSGVTQLPNLEDYHETLERPGKRYDGELSALCTALGSGVGWFFGGPKGAALGFNLGNQLGSKVGEMLSDDGHIEHIYTGNNRHEVENAVVKALTLSLHRYLQESYVAPVHEAVTAIERPVHEERKALLALEAQLDTGG